MVLLTPTSIAYTGTSASIGTNGSVTFTAVSSLSLNGVFDATYDNYMVVWNTSNTGTTSGFYGRLRASGTDATGATDYTRQVLTADSTTVAGSRQSINYFIMGFAYGVLRVGYSMNVYGPYLAQPTAMRSVSASDSSSARIYDVASTHNQSTSYDGLTWYSSTSQSHTGSMSVYGLVGA